MRKFVCIVLIVFSMCACTFRKSEEYTVEEIINHSNKSETIGIPFQTEVEWVVKPSMVMESVEMIKTEPPLGYPILEHVGYPQEWDYMAGKGPFIVDNAEYTGSPVYTANAIAVAHKGIYDYDGNLLNSGEYTGFSTEAGVIYRDLENGLIEVCSGDFIGTVERNDIDGLCGGGIGLFEYNGTLYTDVSEYDDIGRDIVNFGCDLFWEDINIEEYLKYRKATAADLFGHRAEVDIVNKTVSMQSHYDSAIYDEKGNRLFVFTSTEDTWVDDFTNGFLTIVRVTGNSAAREVSYAFYSVDEQKYITDFDYEDVLPFVEAYAAVKKDGKWAFINEKGELVTDFIWDNVSTMYNGRVYVGLKDRFGILDLKSTLVRGKKVTLETCYGSTDPEAAYAAISALDEYVPKQMERDPETVAEEEIFEKAHKIIGIITPRFDDINIREKPSTSAEVADVLRDSDPSNEGELYYPQYVYDVTEAEGYTWYRIGTDRWVADHGNWYEVEMFKE
ncbi:MAG: WG repeat-containing protein [Erysipelotrichaceae bacterium]|nr:WG repeat-containing protein [Erysipelotrichaceae bacterium]